MRSTPTDKSIELNGDPVEGGGGGIRRECVAMTIEPSDI